MTMDLSRLQRLWVRFFDARSDPRIARDARRKVLREPLIRNALRNVRQSERRSDRLLASLEALEGEKRDE